MRYISDSHAYSRKEPRPGEIIWLVPIRYWEIDDYQPIKFEVKSVSLNSDGRRFVTGFHHGYGHDVFFCATDARWYYGEERARQAQMLMAKLHTIISNDENHHHIRRWMEEENILGGSG